MFQNWSWWQLHNSEDILKIIELYTSNGWLSSVWIIPQENYYKYKIIYNEHNCFLTIDIDSNYANHWDVVYFMVTLFHPVCSQISYFSRAFADFIFLSRPQKRHKDFFFSNLRSFYDQSDPLLKIHTIQKEHNKPQTSTHNPFPKDCHSNRLLYSLPEL